VYPIVSLPVPVSPATLAAMYRIRPHLRPLAATVLLLVSVLGAWSTFAHGLDCHDRDGEPVVVVHDASAHAFRSTAPPADERPVHCVLCHWTRVFGPGVYSVATSPDVASRTFAAPIADVVVARLIGSAQPPLRAPPAGSTLDVVA